MISSGSGSGADAADWADNGLDMVLGADFSQVDAACAAMQEKLEAWGLEGLEFKMQLLVREALNNAVCHGSGLDPSRKVEFSLHRGPGSLEIRVADQGGGFDWRQGMRREPDPLSESGRGVFIMRTLADGVLYNDSGNRVLLTVNIDAEADMATTTKEDNGAVMVPEGDIIASTAQTIRDDLKALVDRDVTSIEMDMKNVALIDSVGLGLLISACNSLEKKGGRLTVRNVSPDIAELFANMRLDQHFTVIKD
jgi:anti-anti-sigma factor